MTLLDPQDLRIVLRDARPEVLEGWRDQFAERHPRVEIVDGDPVGADTEAVVCPGNGFGFMDSGLALRMCEALGWEVQDRVRDGISSRPDAELFVGQALVIDTGNTPGRLIYAPIMRTELSAESVGVYLAGRATLLAIARHNEDHPSERIGSVTFPGLVGDDDTFHGAVAARQLRYAYEEVIGVRKVTRKNLSQLVRRERKLRTIPRSTQE